MMEASRTEGRDFPLTEDEITASVNALIERGLMAMDGENAKVTAKGLAFVRHVLPRSVKPVFSA